jgi:glycosyltransferase involved in cell wall biosynthesis
MRRRVEGKEQLNDMALALSKKEFTILGLFNRPRELVELLDMGRISVLVPAFNEAKNIAVLMNDLTELPWIDEVVVIDGSTDETAQIARALGARIIIQNGKGKGGALRQAFEAEYVGDIIVTVDADGSNRIEEIPRLVEQIIDGADIAKGSRFLKGGGSSDLTWARKIGNRLFLALVNRLWLTHYTDLCYGFVAYRKSALAKLAPVLESNYFEIETEIFIKANKLGLKVVEVPSIELSRQYGNSKLRGVHDGMRILKTILHEVLCSARERVSTVI